MKPVIKTSALLFFIASMIYTSCIKENDQISETVSVNSPDFDTITFQSSMKGWELYSWPERDNYRHSLLPGTNRLKTYNEVITNPYTAHGTDSLKLLLARLPEGEHIFWIGRDWLQRCWAGQSYGDLMVP
ncbi:MAG TPA: hypothetical protein VHI78_11950, partial [Bacteroidales bacterium]|nr:hypothetical protein [Bacteroidales bacterium]